MVVVVNLLVEIYLEMTKFNSIENKNEIFSKFTLCFRPSPFSISRFYWQTKFKSMSHNSSNSILCLFFDVVQFHILPLLAVFVVVFCVVVVLLLHFLLVHVLIFLLLLVAVVVSYVVDVLLFPQLMLELLRLHKQHFYYYYHVSISIDEIRISMYEKITIVNLND